MFDIAVDISYVIKIIFAIVVGFTIGFERQIHSHDAGIKTNILICISACVCSIMSYSISGADIGRIAAQILPGIGFIGAGCILKDKKNIRGLTTASILLVTASLGLCIGFGYYFLAFVSVFLMQATLFIIKKVEHLWRKK